MQERFGFMSFNLWRFLLARVRYGGRGKALDLKTAKVPQVQVLQALWTRRLFYHTSVRHLQNLCLAYVLKLYKGITQMLR